MQSRFPVGVRTLTVEDELLPEVETPAEPDEFGITTLLVTEPAVMGMTTLLVTEPVVMGMTTLLATVGIEAPPVIRGMRM